MKKLLLAFIFGIMLLSLTSVSAVEQTLGIVQQNTCVSLTQTCANCTFVNVTSVVNPDSTIVTINNLMTKAGTDYNYTFCQVNDTGDYTYNTLGDPDGILVVQPVGFTSTFNGEASPEGITIVLFILLFLVIIGYMTFMLIETIGYFRDLEVDVKDVAKNFTSYFVLFAIYILSKSYLGNSFIDDFLLWIIGIGAFTNMFIPLVGFILSITIGKLSRKDFS